MPGTASGKLGKPGAVQVEDDRSPEGEGNQHQSCFAPETGVGNDYRTAVCTDLQVLQEKTRERIGNVELPENIREATILPFFQAVEDIHLKSDYPDEIRENSSLFYIYMLILISKYRLCQSPSGRVLQRLSC